MQYRNRWNIITTAAEMAEDGEALAIAKALGNRGCLTPEAARAFLGKEEEQLHDPFLMKDMDKAAARIREAVEKGERIVIYGD